MDKIKKYCFIFLILVLFIPIIQRFIKFHKSEPLEGLNAPVHFPTFHYKDWKEGTYQNLVENYVAGNFGFRNSLVRAINNIDYWIFKTSNTDEVVIGKDRHLFFDYNIERYLGIKKQNENEIDSLFVITDSLITNLNEHGVEFIFVITPSSAFYYNDKFPKQYDSYKPRPNDYEYYVKKLEEYNINYIDFNKWFLDIKDTVSIDLFPKNGTHYTYFSAVWVADSLLKYMENLKDIDIPDIITDDYVIDSMRPNEHDLENILNLSSPLDNEKMIYYNLKFETAGKDKPKVLTVGDSFYWTILNQLIPLNCFSNVEYWFYNIQVFPESFTNEKHPGEVDLDSLFNNLDFIVVYSSSTLLHNYDYTGFIGQILNYFTDDYTVTKENSGIQYWINAIKNNPEWLNAIEKKALNHNIPVETQIRREAEWMLKQQQ
ncbi:MAG: hypothetical protein PHZ24_11925 [Bacteroidales bacterium]|nr:hypothetical protein [Bacteroidales bacterium]